MLYYNTITPAQKELLAHIAELNLFADFYLAGGTGLSLQLGHRMSIDLDFFSVQPFNPQKTNTLLGPKFTIELISNDTLIGEIRGVRISFFHFPYPLLSAPVLADNISVASLSDIAAMKVNAIIGRGSKKDFIDLYAIIHQTGQDIASILNACVNKFPGFQKLIAVKALSYFADADKETLSLPLFMDAAWEQIKHYFIEHVSKNLP